MFILVYITKGEKMKDWKNEHEIISELLSDLKDELKDLDTTDDMLRYSNILQAENALERIKDSAQSVENFVNSLQRKFKREE
tara:strand:- start:501 stop:746 length:246 start_codon:yes stop_codon:yes gene_type:complete